MKKEEKMNLSKKEYLKIYELSQHIEKHDGQLFIRIYPHVECVDFSLYVDGWVTESNEDPDWIYTLYYGATSLKTTMKDVIKSFNNLAAEINFPVFNG